MTTKTKLKKSADPYIPGLQLGQVEDRDGKYFLRWAAKARNKRTGQVIELKEGTHLAHPEQFDFLGAAKGPGSQARGAHRTRRVRRSRGVRRKLKTRGRRTRGRRYRGRASRGRKARGRGRRSRRA